MKMTMKHGALALALLGSAALFAGPTLANSLHDEGDFGGGYRIIGPSGGPERYDYVRHHNTFGRSLWLRSGLELLLWPQHRTLGTERGDRLLVPDA